MTDTTANTGPETAPESPQDNETPTTEAATPTPTDVQNPAAQAAAREAAKYRARLRDAEEQLTAAQEHVRAMQRAEVERIAGTRIRSPEDFWQFAPSIDELCDENGTLDPDTIESAIDNVLAARPHWRKPVRVTEPTSSVTSRDTIESKQSFTFEDAFRPR